MKAKMSQDGVITLEPETGVEAYALQKWAEGTKPVQALIIKTPHGWPGHPDFRHKVTLELEK